MQLHISQIKRVRVWIRCRVWDRESNPVIEISENRCRSFHDIVLYIHIEMLGLNLFSNSRKGVTQHITFLKVS